jgi:nucleoid-associated protein YejK
MHFEIYNQNGGNSKAYLTFLNSDIFKKASDFKWEFDSCAFGPQFAASGCLWRNLGI